ncbi:hypothetical protein, partial [Paenibacillus macerans]|uniref:hypothetical protein n=1 Tax=Paenibacillus macerans TaxID=44252 RepID=UPI001C3F7689
ALGYLACTLCGSGLSGLHIVQLWVIWPAHCAALGYLACTLRGSGYPVSALRGSVLADFA